MSYAYQLKGLTFDGKLVTSLACCCGKVYALSTGGSFIRVILHVDIVVKDKEVVIKLELFGSCPYPPDHRDGDRVEHYLKESGTQLLYIKIFLKGEQMIPCDVYLYVSNMARINWDEREVLKYWDLSDYNPNEELAEDDLQDLGMSEKTWEHITDLENTNFFVDLGRDRSVSFVRPTASELGGGFIHIRSTMGETIYSYHDKNDTISLCPIPSPMLPASHMRLWEFRLKDDLGEGNCIVDSKVDTENDNEILLRSSLDDGVKYNESYLLDAPFHILETIMEFCVGVEYMKFRATCKQCHLAAPLAKWRNDTSIRRLETSSAASPWLMVVDENRSVVTFTDPMFGDSYFMKRSHISSILNRTFYGSRFGWLLFESRDLDCLVFFNPFTNDIRELPYAERHFPSLCFSAPPTSLDCMVVGFGKRRNVDVLLVNQEQTWRTLRLGPDPYTISFPTFCDRDVYALRKDRQLIVVNNLDKEDYSWKIVEAETPKGSCISSPQYFLTSCNEDLLLVIVAAYGGPVEVYKLNESKQEWEKIDSVGKHTIYICRTTCQCIEAKVPKMENKVFFAHLHTKNGKVVFYSLDTCKYHTFDGENLQVNVGDLLGTTYHLSHHAWIEPSWS